MSGIEEKRRGLMYTTPRLFSSSFLDFECFLIVAAGCNS